MTDYVVKVRFWLRAYDSVVLTAATDAEAVHLARAAARRLMTATTHPEDIDLDERREGHISYIDRLDDARREITDANAFDGDRPFHADIRNFTARVASLASDTDPGAAKTILLNLVVEARELEANSSHLAPASSTSANAWGPDRIYEYQGAPYSFAVSVVDDAGIVHGLDPRFDLRNHSPTGFAWGYGGSGPAQLALAILTHALNCDERAEQLYQAFKNAVIAQLDPGQPWRLTSHDVLGWVLQHAGTVAGDASVPARLSPHIHDHGGRS